MKSQAVVVSLAFFVLGLAVVDCMLGTVETSTCRIIDKSHTASSVGTGITSGGDVAVTSHPESWEIIVDDHGKTVAVEVNSHDWRRAQIGGTYYLRRRIGWSGFRY